VWATIAALTTIMIRIVLIAITKIIAIPSIVTTTTEHYEFWNLRLCTQTGRRIQNTRAQNQKPVWEDGGGGEYVVGTAATEACCFCLCNQLVPSYPLRFLRAVIWPTKHARIACLILQSPFISDVQTSNVYNFFPNGTSHTTSETAVSGRWVISHVVGYVTLFLCNTLLQECSG
jgi:hypothetical protein